MWAAPSVQFLPHYLQDVWGASRCRWVAPTGQLTVRASAAAEGLMWWWWASEDQLPAQTGPRHSLCLWHSVLLEGSCVEWKQSSGPVGFMWFWSTFSLLRSEWVKNKTTTYRKRYFVLPVSAFMSVSVITGSSDVQNTIEVWIIISTSLCCLDDVQGPAVETCWFCSWIMWRFDVSDLVSWYFRLFSSVFISCVNRLVKLTRTELCWRTKTIAGSLISRHVRSLNSDCRTLPAESQSFCQLDLYFIIYPSLVSDDSAVSLLSVAFLTGLHLTVWMSPAFNCCWLQHVHTLKYKDLLACCLLFKHMKLLRPPEEDGGGASPTRKHIILWKHTAGSTRERVLEPDTFCETSVSSHRTCRTSVVDPTADPSF